MVTINRMQLAITVSVACMIALITPFDVLFDAASLGSPVLRVVLMATLATAGAWFAAQTGMRLELSGPGRPALSGIAGAAGVALWVIVLDCVLFRHQLSPGYVGFLQRPLGERLEYFMLRAFNENVLYRLFLFSFLAWLASRISGNKALPTAVWALAMIASQVINIGANTVAASAGTATFLTLAYDGLRYVVPGIVWAMLFRRNGFAAVEIASVGCHVFLQPAFSVLL